LESEYYSPHAAAKRRADARLKARGGVVSDSSTPGSRTPGGVEAAKLKRLEEENKRLRARMNAKKVAKKAKPGSALRQAAAAEPDPDAEVLDYMVSPRSGEPRGLPGTHNKAAQVAYARTVLKNSGKSSSASYRQQLAEAALTQPRKKQPPPRAAAGFPSARAAARGGAQDDDEREEEEDEEDEEEEEGNGHATSPSPNGRASREASRAPASPPPAGVLPPGSPAISAEQLALIVAEQVQAELARIQLRSPDGGAEYSRADSDLRCALVGGAAWAHSSISTARASTRDFVLFFCARPFLPGLCVAICCGRFLARAHAF
jgi:hypothetical protein